MDSQSNSKLSKIIYMFNSYGCSQDTLISKQKLVQIMNKQANINLHHSFSTSIIEEMWGQAETTSRGQATMHTLSKIYQQSMQILQQRIRQINTTIPQKQQQLSNQTKKLNELQQKYQQNVGQNYDKINTVRKNIVAIQNNIKQTSKSKSQFQKQLQEMNECLEVEQKTKIQHPIEQSHYMQTSLQSSISSAPSPHLSLIFKVTVIAIVLQTIFLVFHQSFLSLLCYIFIIYWLFVGYFDQYFVKSIILGLILSCILDLTCVTLSMLGKLGANRYFSKQKTWLYVSMIIILLQIALRILLIIKLVPFRQPTAKREYFMLFSNEIELHTRSGKVFND